MDREEFLARRKTGLGGSDIGAVCGINPWKSPTQVWLDKVYNLDQNFSNEAMERMEWGNLLEEPIARKTAETLGATVRRNNKLLSDPDHFMIGNLDRVLTYTDDRKAILEIKTTDARNLKQWQDEGVPAHYQLQVQSYMHLTGIQKAVVATLFGGQKLLFFEIDGDKEIQQYICKIAADFWTSYVIPKAAPPMDESSLTAATLNALYPSGNGQTIVLPDDATRLIMDYEDYNRQEKAAKEAKEAAKMQLQAMLGEAELGIADGKLVKWKNTTRKGYTVEETTYRNFGISTLKEAKK